MSLFRRGLSAVASYLILKASPHARFYEGGKKTLANQDFYNANSPFENTAAPDRSTMRARARWLHENNPIMSNIDEAILNNVIGKGIGLQSKTGIKKVDAEIEKRFKNWIKKENCDITKTSSFFDMQRIILHNRMDDGEIFIYKMRTKEGLKLQLLEADSLDETQGENGITYDENGAPKIYHFKNADYTTQNIDALKIINYFKKVRPTQKRGVSEYKQAIVDIKNFSAFQSATIQAARARANIAYTVETTRQEAFEKPGIKDDHDEDLVDINGLMVYYLRQGEQVKSLDSQNGGANYGEFVNSTVRLMAVARKVSYELAFRDYSQVNFASARASLIQDNKRFDIEQTHFIDHVLVDIFREWLDLEVMLGKIKSIKRTAYLNDELKYIEPRFTLPRREWVDPIKDLTSAQMEIDMGSSTNTDFCAARGTDYEENIITKRKELDLKKEILGEYYDEVVATEQKNQELLKTIITVDNQNNQDQQNQQTGVKN